MPVILTFAAGHTLNALSVGVQLVLVAWLAASTLDLPARQVGWVQAAVLLPNLLLLLRAGVTADRRHAGVVLAIANLALAVIHGAALVCFLTARFDLGVLLAYGLALGIGNAFVQTAREKLVAQLGHDNLQTVISLAGICQFVAQGLGIAAASLTDWLGPHWLFGLQLFACLLAAIAYGMLVRSVNPGVNVSLRVRSAIGEALREAWRCVPVRHILLVVGFNGLMHLGMFIVLLPLLARDVMQFSSLEYGFLQLSFVVGTVVAHFLILHRRVRYPGQNILFSLLYTGVIGFAMSAGPTVFGLFALVFIWGCVAGVSANLSRLVVQSLMPVELRGRSMALYQLALFGLAPIGALLGGYLVDHGGTELAFQAIGFSSGALFVLSLFSKRLWAVSSPEKGVIQSEP